MSQVSEVSQQPVASLFVLVPRLRQVRRKNPKRSLISEYISEDSTSRMTTKVPHVCGGSGGGFQPLDVIGLSFEVTCLDC